MGDVVIKIVALLSVAAIGCVGYFTTKKCKDPDHHHHVGTTQDMGSVNFGNKNKNSPHKK